MIASADTTLTAEVVGAVLVCVGTAFTGFGASGIGRLKSKVPTVESMEIEFITS